MPCGLVWGMNDHQGSCWVLIVVTGTHRPPSANLRRSQALQTRSAKRTATRCGEECWLTPFHIRELWCGLLFSVAIRPRIPWPAASAHLDGQEDR